MKNSMSGNVRVTADALIHLRATSPLARHLAIEWSYDHLFHSEEGGPLAKMAMSLDPVYEPFNVARYAWFSRRMSDLADCYPQLVVLGAGYDTRSLLLGALKTGKCRVFEVDYPEVLAAKLSVLSRSGVALPEGLSHVGCDLNSAAPALLLTAAGFDQALPTAVVMEGVYYFLRGEKAVALLAPETLGLAPGSTLTFDVWTASRTRRLNEMVLRRTGRHLFGDALLGDSSAEIAAALWDRGYHPTLFTLDQVSRDYGFTAVADPIPDSWLVIDARLI